MMPIQYMKGLGTHLQLELPKRVVAIREKRDRLVHLEVWRVQHLVETALRLGVQGLHKPKALERGRFVLFFTLVHTPDTLANNDLEVMLLQRLRGRSHPLQSWRCELSALEDEAPLELPPRASLLKPFTFHNQIRDETSRNRMGLCAFLGGGLGLPGAGVPSLTGLEAQLALQHLDHFFHLMPFPVQPAHLVGG